MRRRASAPPSVPASRPLRLRAATCTDVGAVRERNEDAAHVDPDLQLYLVADGIGGHQAGDVASTMAIELVRTRVAAERAAIDAFVQAPGEESRRQLKEMLAAAVREAHHALRDRASREADKMGMGTTLELALIAGRDVLIAHVGDSRTYLFRNQLASQLTRDHTMAQVQVFTGEMTAEEAETSPLASVMINAVGIAAEVTVDVVHLELRDGDRLMLCSDGLYDYFTREELAERLCRGAARQRLVDVVAEARARGGHDNITGVIIEVTASGLPLRAPTAQPKAEPPPVPPRDRRQVAVGTAPPAAGLAAVDDVWEEETTVPRVLPLPGLRRLVRGEPAAEVMAAATGNPFGEITDETLSGFVEHSLYEEAPAAGSANEPTRNGSEN